MTAAPNTDNSIALFSWQQRVAAVPEEYDLSLDGGRGGGKSFLVAFLVIASALRHGRHARILYVRQTLASLRDFEDVLRDLVLAVFGTAARFNASDHLWRLPNGGTIELGYLRDPADYQRYQGRSFSLICVDEASQFPEPRFIDLLRSNLRARKGIPTRMIFAANPGSLGHAWYQQRFVNPATPWQPCKDETTGAEFVRCPSTYTDNPALDHDDYAGKLRQACGDDEELLKAWLTGDWNIARGAYFATVIDERRVALDPLLWNPTDFAYEQHRRGEGGSWLWNREVGENRWRLYLAHDYGSAAPSCTYVCAVSPGTTGADGRYYAPGSVLLLDELATNRPGSLSEGMTYTIPRLADEIRELAKRWGIQPEGVADDACFARGGHQAGSIAEEFAAQGVYFEPARKGDRLSGWQRMRTMLANAGQVDVAGLYVSKACRYWWATVPTLARDPRRPEDLDTRGPDHAADACRYALLRDGGLALSLELT